MKKINNYTLLMILAICAAFLIGVKETKATASPTIICESGELNYNKSETTSCYLVAHLADGEKYYGMDTTIVLSYLKLVGVKTGSTDIGYEKKAVGQAYENFASLTCANGITIANGTECVGFYSIGGGQKIVKNISTIDTITNIDSDFTVIGSYEVQLTDDAPADNCGKICALVKAVSTNNGSTDTDVAAQYQSESLDATLPYCKELTVKKTNDNPPTGNFISYVVLASGAILAIGAVLVANKNKKFYRV